MIYESLDISDYKYDDNFVQFILVDKTVGFRLGRYKGGSVSVVEPENCLIIPEEMKSCVKVDINIIFLVKSIELNLLRLPHLQKNTSLKLHHLTEIKSTVSFLYFGIYINQLPPKMDNCEWSI